MKSLKEYLPEGWAVTSEDRTVYDPGYDIGDDVIVTGPVQFKGCTGVVSGFDSQRAFVVVNLYNHGKHSFHASDVSVNEYADSDEELEDMYDSDTDAREWMHNNELAEVKKLPVVASWETWNPDDYNTPDQFFQSLSNAILEFVKEKYGGQAWFKGGSYAYKIDVKSPNKLVASDGSEVTVDTIAKGLEDYCGRANFDDFVDCDPEYWTDFFRPVKNAARLASDGAPLHGNDQAEHEYNNMMGESDELANLKRLAGM